MAPNRGNFSGINFSQIINVLLGLILTMAGWQIKEFKDAAANDKKEQKENMAELNAKMDKIIEQNSDFKTDATLLKRDQQQQAELYRDLEKRVRELERK